MKPAEALAQIVARKRAQAAAFAAALREYTKALDAYAGALERYSREGNTPEVYVLLSKTGTAAHEVEIEAQNARKAFGPGLVPHETPRYPH